MTTSTIALHVSALTGRTVQQEQGQTAGRMRSLLEWERAFLAEQQWTQAHDTAHSGEPASAGPPVRERQDAVEHESAKDTAANQEVKSAVRGAERNVVGRGTLPVERVNDSAASRAPSLGVVPATMRRSEGARDVLRVNEAFPRHVPTDRPASDAPRMVVTVAEDIAQIWLRQPGQGSALGLGTILRMRDVLTEAGLRLARVTVNGETRWYADESSGMGLGKTSDTEVSSLEKHV